MYANMPRRILLKGKRELEGMRKAGRLAAQCLREIIEQVQPGMSTQDIDDLQMDFAKRHGVIPAPLNYKGYPKSICTSVNEVICHGIPNPKDILKEGDIVGIDVTLIVDGFHGDTAATIPVGKISPQAQKLLVVTLTALQKAIQVVRPGNRLGDIGHAIQSFVEPHGFSVVRDFVGHGIGRGFHEEPQVPHYGRPNRGVRLKAGMTFTIEPMINQGTYHSKMLSDGWTAVTRDGKLSAQYEHTLAVTPMGVEILTVENDSGAWQGPGGFDPAEWGIDLTL